MAAPSGLQNTCNKKKKTKPRWLVAALRCFPDVAKKNLESENRANLILKDVWYEIAVCAVLRTSRMGPKCYGTGFNAHAKHLGSIPETFRILAAYNFI